ncbi:MAG TPA: hypothetical protein VI216_15355, partial [Candidatus Acidoferrales bacterium]
VSGICILPVSQAKLDRLRHLWERTLKVPISHTVLNDIEMALRSYVAAQDIQSRMANAAKVRDLLAKVESHAAAIWGLLSDSSEDARTALARLVSPLDSDSILPFVAQLQERAGRQANKLSALRRGADDNPAFDVLIHRLDRLCDQAGINIVIAFNESRAVNEHGNDDYSAGYVSPYLDFLIELLAPAELSEHRGALAKAVQRARRKDIVLPESTQS